MRKRHIELLLVPPDGGTVRQLRLPPWTPRVLLGSACLLLLLLVLAGTALVGGWQMRAENFRLFTENEALRHELVALGEEIDGLQGTVSRHIHLANEARLLAGLPPHSEEVALLGVGGTPPAGSGSHRVGITPAVGETVGHFRDRLEQVGRQLLFQEESFVEVTDLIETNKDRLDHIPTVDPVRGRHYLSSGFGPRRDPFTGRPSHHHGIDLCAARGTPFSATADGQVICAGSNGHLGKTIKIDHGNGFVTVYAHADRLCVRKGQQVRRGDVIGEVGNTGRSTGDHLHYEVRKDGAAVNPRRYILTDVSFLD